MITETVEQRLERLRQVLRSESISYGELAELADLAKFIEPGDVELLEPAGVPEEFADAGGSWSTEELQRDFTVEGFAMGIVVVTRKLDGQKGTLTFDHAPRRYYGWKLSNE